MGSRFVFVGSLQLAVAVLVTGIMLISYLVLLIVNKAFVDVTVTRLGVIVVVGTTVTEGLVTVLGGSVVV